MRNKLILTVAAVAAFTACSTAVKAVQIDGIVNLVGTVEYTPNNGQLSTATAATLWVNDYVFNQASGDFWTTFALDFPTPVTMAATPWVFNPSTGKFHLIGLGGNVWYNLANATITTQDNAILGIQTTGTILAPGFDPTPGIFNFTSQGPATPNPSGNGTWDYTWSGALGSVNRFQVPDGGTTALMLGSVFLVIGLLRNKLGA